MADKGADSDSDGQSFHSLQEDEDENKHTSSNKGQNHDRQPSHTSKSTTSSPPHKPANSSAEAEQPLPKLSQRERFPPEEEQAFLTTSNEQKQAANQLFGKGSYENAIKQYSVALGSCPNYLDYEVAVLNANIAACHLKLQEWRRAIDAADNGVACLERLEKLPVPKSRRGAGAGKHGVNGKAEANGTLEGEGKDEEEADDGAVEEVDDELEERIENLRLSGHTLDEVRKMQVKLLMRRAKARTETPGTNDDGGSGGGSVSSSRWASLQAAEEDYAVLLQPSMQPFLSAADKQSVMRAARELTPKLNEARDREMADMMGKLKGLGNSLLKPFGLSTENFQFVKDEKTGGYSMNFNQGGKA